jgi:hypothetical protein
MVKVENHAVGQQTRTTTQVARTQSMQQGRTASAAA